MADEETVNQLKEEVSRLALMVKDQDEKLKKQEELLKASETRPTVMVHSRRVDRFRDRPSAASDPSVTDWVADVRTQAQSRKLSDADEAAFMLDNLAGKARQEILGRGDSVTKNPDEIVKVLYKVFGDGDNLPMLQQRFYGYYQRDEDLVSCSLNMVELYDKIVQLDDSFRACRDASLKGRFAEAVKDIGLKRELRRLNVETPGLSFFELRDRAVHWIGRCAEKKSVTNQEHVSSDSPDINEVLRKQESMIKQQQIQIDRLMSRSKKDETTERTRQRKCWHCGSPSHMRNKCPKLRQDVPRTDQGKNLNW